jgi:predicted SprT family Zn-dependent metalloprotease
MTECVRAVAALANRVHGFPVENIRAVTFDLRGRAAGQCRSYLQSTARTLREAMRDAPGAGNIVADIRLNMTAWELDAEQMLGETIPHEVAHAVSMWKYGPALGKGHGPLWQSVARSLGSTGDRCHALPLPKARRSREYIYRLPKGGEVVMGAQRHAKIMRGGAYRHTRTGERIDAAAFAGERGPSGNWTPAPPMLTQRVSAEGAARAFERALLGMFRDDRE